MVISLGPWAAGFDGCIHSFSCVSAAPRSTNPEVPPPSLYPAPASGRLPLVGSGTVCPGTLLPLRRRPSRVVSIGGVDANFFHCSRDARTTLGWFRSPGCRAGPLREGTPARSQRPAAPHYRQTLNTTCVVICTVSCLNGRLPLAERAAVRSDLGSGLALDRPALSGGLRARRCPKLQKTYVLLVWMRSVDDWPLARIRTRFPGVSCGRYPLTNWST